MLHQISTEKLGRHGEAMTAAVQACVHCGFCLPTCPTYRVLGQEMESPRGRIFLMKEVLEGKLPADEAQPHLDRCLGCLACETSCPSGVRYGELLVPYRGDRQRVQVHGVQRFRRWMVSSTLPYPFRFRWAMRLAGWARGFPAWIIPPAIRPMIGLVPEKISPPVSLPSMTPALGPRRAKVALLAGCAQQVLAPQINAAAIRVLARNGCEVHIPANQTCCGALAWHTGNESQAIRFAVRNLQAFDGDYDFIVTTAAGCGSGLHDYSSILRGTSYADAAQALTAKTVDISVLLDRLGWEAPPPLERPLRVAYHDACHLQHAQRVRTPPRRLLESIQGLVLSEIEDAEICCGSAGTYNIDQPDIAEALGKAKAAKIMATHAEVVVLGNIGCQVQIERYLRLAGSKTRVLHTIELLDAAYRRQIHDVIA